MKYMEREQKPRFPLSRLSRRKQFILRGAAAGLLAGGFINLMGESAYQERTENKPPTSQKYKRLDDPHLYSPQEAAFNKYIHNHPLEILLITSAAGVVTAVIIHKKLPEPPVSSP